MIAYFGYFWTTQSSKWKKVGLAILFSGEISLHPSFRGNYSPAPPLTRR